MTSAFGKYIWIPRAVDIDGEIMRVYDPMNHEMVMPSAHQAYWTSRGSINAGYALKRPTLIAGGELTMDMLEVQLNRDSNISEAPLQLKSKLWKR